LLKTIKMSFSNEELRKLAVSNYLINPNTLIKYLPVGTELDLYDNKC
jgi:hypothetical protein